MKLIAAALLLLQVVSQQPYIETFEVRLHNLDVVVTDRQGKPVSGLTKDDFVVTEDGAAQEITNFAEYSQSEGNMERRALSPPSEQRAESPPLHRPARQFIFFIDEMSLHPVSRGKLLKNATALLEKSLSPGDTAAVIRPHGEKNVVQNYTGDLNEIVRALGAAIEENSTRIDTQQAAELRFLELQLADTASKLERQYVRHVYADMVRRRVEQRLGQLRALVSSFAGTEGKKVLVLMTTSLYAEPGRESRDFGDEEIIGASESGFGGATLTEVAADVGMKRPTMYNLRPQIDELARTAAANGVTIYPLYPDVQSEFSAPGREAPRRQLALMSATGRIPRGRTQTLPGNIFNQLLDNTETTLVSLAEKTGGRWFRGDGNIDDIFRQVGDDLRSYYSLAYRVKGDADKARRIEVRVKNRPELRVRTRTEVLAKSPTKEMEDLVVAHLVYPRNTNELAIRAQPSKPKKNNGNLFTIPVETQIPMERLTFLAGPDGRYHAHFSVHYAAAGEKSDFASGQERLQEVTITEEELLALEGKTFRYSSDLLVAAGHVKIAVGVLDRTSKLSGFATISMWAQ